MIRKYIFAFIILIISLFFCVNGLAIEVEGEVSGVWTIDDSPVSVLDTIFIPQDDTLTIEPGVIVNFSGTYSILVHGELLAEGTEDDSIVFHPDEDVKSWCGIRADSGAVISLGYCIVRDCSVGDEDIPISGGAIFCRNAELNISNSTFFENQCSQIGGAVYFVGGTTNIVSSMFSYNVSTEIGGAICISGRHSSILENTFNRNSSIFGGALYIGSESRIANNEFISNSANFGGAIYTTTNLEEDCVISGNTFTENQAGNGGALLINDFNSIVVHHNIFYSNNADNCAGGVGFMRNINNTLFYSNTLVYNESRFGGGIGFMLNIGGNNEITLSDCIFWGNRADEGNQILFYDFFGWVFLSYCNIEGEWPEEYSDHVIHEDPQFIDHDNDDFHLSEDSPCIDSGDPESDPDPDGTRSDIGAFHFHQRDIELASDTLLFETPGVLDSAAVTIRNIGLTTLTITAQSITPDDSHFSIGNGNGEFEIEPESEHTTWILFAPYEAGEYEAVLHIESDDPDEEEVEVSLVGTSLNASCEEDNSPAEFRIVDVYPNPFNATTTITYSLPQYSYLSLTITDVNGRKIEMTIKDNQPPGVHSYIIGSDNLSSGIYFIQLAASGEVRTRKVVLLR